MQNIWKSTVRVEQKIKKIKIMMREIWSVILRTMRIRSKGFLKQNSLWNGIQGVTTKYPTYNIFF